MSSATATIANPNPIAENPAPTPRKRGLFGVLSFLRPYPGAVAASIGLLLVNLAIELSLPRLIGEAINRHRLHAESGVAVVIGGITIGYAMLVTLRAVNGFILGPIRNRLVQRTLLDIRCAIYDAIQRLPFAYHDRTNTGELISRSTADIGRLQDFLFASLFLSVDIAVALLVTLVLISLIHPLLGALALGTLLPTVGLIAWFAAKLQPRWREVHDLHGKMTTVIQENIAGVRVVKAFAREHSEVSRFLKRRQDFLQTLMHAVNYWAARVPFAQFIHGLSVPIALWTGGRLVVRGEIGVGELTSAVLYLMAIGHRMGAVGQFTNILQNAKAAAERVMEVLDEPRTIVGGRRILPATTAEAQPPSIEFQAVRFEHSSGKVALTDVSVTLPPGHVTAVVGPTGAGKSTLVSLIPRFHDPTHGTVRVDGADVREFTLGSLRQAIGIVFQESYLFSSTIAENIAYGRPGATRDEIMAAARAAEAHDFILALEKGYDTVVGERGVTLSGGQKQRIAIARAFLTNPRILILDDATASVDSATEHRIQTAMERVAKGRTTLIIAHRLSSVQHADRILVLDGGRLVAQGRHDELLRSNPYYASLCTRELH